MKLLSIIIITLFAVANTVHSETFGGIEFNTSSNAIPVLTFHSIEEKVASDNELAISKKKFAMILNDLEKSGYQTITMDYYDKNKSKLFQLVKKPIILTFDDGFKSLYESSAEMKKHRFIGISGVITSRIGKNGHMSYKELNKLKALGYEISSHTSTHEDITKTKNQKYEITDSISVLKKKGFNSASFIYPFGRNNDSTQIMLKKSGIKYGFSNESRVYKPGIDNDYSIPRIRVSEKTDLTTLYKKIGTTN